MNSTYQSNIQPLQGCDILFIVDRGLTPTVIQIVPLVALLTLKSNASGVIPNLYFQYQSLNVLRGI